MQIMGRAELIRLLKAEPNQHDCVIILEPTNTVVPYKKVYEEVSKKDLEILENLPRRKLIKRFWDVALPHINGAPTEKDIKEILVWAQDKDPIVSCRMGVSRSSATALLIECQKTIHGGQAWCSIEKAILDTLHLDLHDPNPLILELGEKVLGKNGIRDRVSDYYKGTLFTVKDYRRF